MITGQEYRNDLKRLMYSGGRGGIVTSYAKAKKLKDKEYRGENEITDLFLATTAYKAIMKTSLTYPREFEELTFDQIKEIILKKYSKIGWSLQTKFIALKQEEPIINFLHLLLDASRFYKFEYLGKEELSIEDELTLYKS